MRSVDGRRVLLSQRNYGMTADASRSREEIVTMGAHYPDYGLTVDASCPKRTLRASASSVAPGLALTDSAFA